MPFQPAPGTIGVVIHGLLAGQLTNNTLYFFQDGADPTVGDCVTIATIMHEWWRDEICPNLPDNWQGVKATAKNLFVNGGAKAVVGITDATGGDAGEAAPNSIAPVVTFDTGQSGKSSHGRNYIPGITNGNVAVNTIEAAWATAIADAYRTLLPGGSHDPSPYFWSVLSRVSNNIVLAEAIAVPVLNVYFTDLTVDSQRRRLPGRGK